MLGFGPSLPKENVCDTSMCDVRSGPAEQAPPPYQTIGVDVKQLYRTIAECLIRLGASVDHLRADVAPRLPAASVAEVQAALYEELDTLEEKVEGLSHVHGTTSSGAGYSSNIIKRPDETGDASSIRWDGERLDDRTHVRIKEEEDWSRQISPSSDRWDALLDLAGLTSNLSKEVVERHVEEKNVGS